MTFTSQGMRQGEKPVYLYFGENILGISSDIVTFKKINSNYLQLNHNAINEYTQYGYIQIRIYFKIISNFLRALYHENKIK